MSKRLRNREWMGAVASLETCVLCGKFGVQVAHSNRDRGMSQRASDHLTAALCPEHHHEIDNGKNLFARGTPSPHGPRHRPDVRQARAGWLGGLGMTDGPTQAEVERMARILRVVRRGDMPSNVGWRRYWSRYACDLLARPEAQPRTLWGRFLEWLFEGPEIDTQNMNIDEEK